MAYDRTQIANLALAALGADLLTDIGQSSTNALRCAAVLDVVLDEVLEAHPWHFAKRRAHLPAAAAAPEFGWGWRFPLPTAPWCLRPLRVEDLPPGARWTYEGRDLLANEPGPLQLLYIARVELSFASAQFAAAAGFRLAAQIAFAVSNSRETEDRMWARYERTLASARSLNAQSAPAEDEAANYSQLLAARR